MQWCPDSRTNFDRLRCATFCTYTSKVSEISFSICYLDSDGCVRVCCEIHPLVGGDDAVTAVIGAGAILSDYSELI